MKTDKELYADDFFDLGWSKPSLAAGEAVYNRLKIGNPDATPFDDLDIDTLDHYCIAAKHAVRAFHREAERTR